MIFFNVYYYLKFCIYLFFFQNIMRCLFFFFSFMYKIFFNFHLPLTPSFAFSLYPVAWGLMALFAKLIVVNWPHYGCSLRFFPYFGSMTLCHWLTVPIACPLPSTTNTLIWKMVKSFHIVIQLYIIISVKVFNSIIYHIKSLIN